MAFALAAASAMGAAAARALPVENDVGRAPPQPIAAAAAQGDTPDRRALTLTIYQNGLSLVHEARAITLSPARDQLTLLDLPARLQPDTLAITLNSTVHVQRQRFRNAKWTPRTLLQAYQGRPVLLMPRSGENGQPRRGILVSAAGDNPIVRIGKRLEIGGPDTPWRIALPLDPRVNVAGPALNLWLSGTMGGRHKLDLIYLSDGLGWQMDYWAELQAKQLRLEGFARIVNHSGGDYPSAKVRLIAGDIARADRISPIMMKTQHLRSAAEASAAEPVLAWHLYRLDQPVSLPDAATLRLQLLRAEGLAVQRYYRVSGNATGNGGETPVRVRLHVDTTTAEQPLALPAGTVRIREVGADGEPRYLGADRIDHTPTGKPLELALGTAFDITARRTRTLFRRLGKDHYEVGWRIELRNAGTQPVTVQLREHLPGDWEIVQHTASHERISSAIAQWAVAVPATGTATMSYQARYQR
ncbi:DUF4139 domain-containing protein [Nitrococcus mobilis]|uniref:DUF4139 domain-containing protein n=1 Tax=Nitrococcus mobilis Nb-231 TaxID=314278 RepID=A4BP92_9GAMM|nr:DUF4139 domain-containing protein [Nitrococcus mobilis]EAR22393.1 hypothetical protein NB231_11674 [Nitrococcus mobilis Nb-231]